MSNPPPLPTDQETRLRAAVARARDRRLLGKGLQPAEEEALRALDAVERTENDARTAFGHFLATVKATTPASSELLPADVSLRLARWAEARKRWETAARSLLEASKGKGRSGPRSVWVRPESIPLPEAVPTKDALAALFSPHHWRSGEQEATLMASVAGVPVWLDLSVGANESAETALREIARQGPSAAQTYLALVSLWRNEVGDAPHETYVTVYASDLLRWQGKKATPRGGYHKEDLLAKGRDIWLLSRIRVPVERSVVDPEGRPAVVRSVERLISLESLDAVESAENGTSLLRFRFHPGRAAGALEPSHCAQVGGALLSYHPVRQKYQILLGFCLARRRPQPGTAFPLTDLLADAAITIPDTRIAAFLTTIEDAINELSRDAVVPGIRLVKPAGWHEMLASRQTREILRRSKVECAAVPISETP